jgi:hypothetical protein
MGFRACAQPDDPFTRKVRELYAANVVSAPRAGIDPLLALAVQDRRVEPRGQLTFLIDGDPPALPPVTSAPAPAMTGVRSASVNASLGFDLSAKFWAGAGSADSRR